MEEGTKVCLFIIYYIVEACAEAAIGDCIAGYVYIIHCVPYKLRHLTSAGYILGRLYTSRLYTRHTVSRINWDT